MSHLVQFTVDGAVLDHGIPSLAFALTERVRVSVIKTRLDALGLPVGSWITDAKIAIRAGRLNQPANVEGELTVADLLDQAAFQLQPGQDREAEPALADFEASENRCARYRGASWVIRSLANSAMVAEAPKSNSLMATKTPTSRVGAKA